MSASIDRRLERVALEIAAETKRFRPKLTFAEFETGDHQPDGSTAIVYEDGHEFECGAYMDGDKLMAECPMCERRYEMYCDPSELGPDSYLHCGGSPRCCP